uniref:Serpentine receptor class gamma n=3 Tax=Bursaphelenchus xylophilus TaxID=6326 RepID=A0A1I7SGP3_BURXY
MLTSDFDNEYAFYLEIAVFVLSSIGSAFFMFMILKRTEQLMQVYQKILMYSSLYDWVVTFTSFFTRPIFFMDEGNCYLISNYFMQMLSDQMQFFFFFSYIFAFHALPAVVALSYYYRYLVVCKEKIMTNSQFVVFAIFATTGSVIMIVLNSMWIMPRYGVHQDRFTEQASKIKNSFLLENKDKIFGIGDN